MTAAKVRPHLHVLSTGRHRLCSPDEIGAARQEPRHRHCSGTYQIILTVAVILCGMLRSVRKIVVGRPYALSAAVARDTSNAILRRSLQGVGSSQTFLHHHSPPPRTTPRYTPALYAGIASPGYPPSDKRLVTTLHSSSSLAPMLLETQCSPVLPRLRNPTTLSCASLYYQGSS